MPSRTALVIKGAGTAEVETDVAFTLRDDYILVKTVAVALNPTDWKQLDSMPSAGAVVGCDYAGIVEHVGAKVRKSFAKGDRVCGGVHGNNPANHEDGAFADYVLAKGDVQMKIASHVSFEEAATLGAGIITVGQALYQSLGLPLPSHPAPTPFAVLIYGGSTASGSLAIGFATRSGLEVVTTCSPKHFALVKAAGAAHAFDYRSPTCAADIRAATHDRLAYAMDCISTPDTARICCEAMGSAAAADGKDKYKYTSLLPLPSLPRADVRNACTMAYSAFGEAFDILGMHFPASAADFDFAVSFAALAEELVRERKIKLHPVGRRDGGLHAIGQGLQELRENRVSGQKLVYTL
ncbi:MAG: hypothetical protein M1826_007270 [Phylliscum demangeonii]|nr:MAG: hypothetical protein M1826_007270 [Phylliscum demangeonii]